MLKKILLSVAIFIGLFLLVGFLLPRDFTVHRSISVKADRQLSYDVLDDLASWENFMPWYSADSEVEFKLGNIRKGVGATQFWSGSGNGSISIIESDVRKGIKYKIKFSERPEDQAVSEFNFQDNSEGTIISWSMSGRVDAPLGGYVNLLMDDMIGSVFEKGLIQFKQYLEDAKAQSPSS